VVVVPRPVARQTVQRALEKVEGEDRTRDELRKGARLADVFEKYGVL
jgi:regulator of RNase E activity RraA